MGKLVFIGSEATGYYSGSYACQGVFVSEEFYNKYSNLLSKLFKNKYFYDLDGKHSEIKGTQIIKKFDDYAKVVEFIETVVDYSAYLVEEELYDVDLDESDKELILKHVDEVGEKLEDIIKNYVKVSFYLSLEHAEKVRNFVDGLTK